MPRTQKLALHIVRELIWLSLPRPPYLGRKLVASGGLLSKSFHSDAKITLSSRTRHILNMVDLPSGKRSQRQTGQEAPGELIQARADSQRLWGSSAHSWVSVSKERTSLKHCISFPSGGWNRPMGEGVQRIGRGDNGEQASNPLHFPSVVNAGGRNIESNDITLPIPATRKRAGRFSCWQPPMM